MIKKIRNETCLKFLVRHKAQFEHISLNGIVDERVTCYGYHFGQKLIAVVSILAFKNKHRIKAFYVDKNYRNEGYAVELIRYVLEKGVSYSVYATPFEQAIFEHLGFDDKTKNPEGKVIRYMEGTL
jgi:GNAT superfamily N-acetyltransferase